MGEGAEVVDLLSKFCIDKLNSDWIRNVIDTDFTEVEDLPSDFIDVHCSTNFKGLFDAVVGSCRHWVDTLPNVSADTDKRLSLSTSSTNLSASPLADKSNRDIHTAFWVSLAENVDVKGLKSLLFYFVHRGQRYDARESDRELGIKASSLYFLLLCVPGSNAFRVFHPILYLKAIEIMKVTTKLKVASSSPKKGRHGGSRGSSRKSHDEQSNGGEDDDEDSEMVMLTPMEANKLIRSLNVLLNDILRLTNRFSLKHSSDCLDETISILIDVSRCETQDAQGIFLGRHGAATVTALSYNAYVALQCICNPIHGKISKIVILIMKHIMYNILMISRGSSDLSSRALGVIRDHSQIFVKYILTQVKEDAYEGVYILIQHICIRVPDKAEYRQKTAQSVVEILRYLPIQLYTRLVKWFFKFSHNEKAGHRLFMLEVISKMLDEKERVGEGEQQSSGNCPIPPQEKRPPSRESSTSSSDSDDSEEEADKENSFLKVTVDHPVEAPRDRNILSHKFLLGIIFSRCRDSGATVRSKALALLADCTYSKNPTIMLAMKQIFFRSRPLMFTTPHIPNNNINLESPLELEGEEDLDLPNAAMVVSMLHRRALDDKVTVRKSSLQVLENLMKLDNEMLSVKNLEVLVEHCRDPALLIRKQMITSLSGLVETYPENDAVVTAWIKGAFPLILDPEMKVQEKVVEHLDQLLFRRLLPYNHPQGGTPDHNLPWVIISSLTKLSYHKFFNKALMIWSKSECNRPQIVNIVRSHMGGENNEGMWTLLACLSNYVAITDAAFVVDYFEEHCQINSEVASYTLQQVLKVLSNSIQHIPGNRGEALQERLLYPVSNFTVGAQLISSMMDTITLLSYSMHGDEEEGQKAIEKWVAPILKSCDDHLKSVLFEKSIQLDNEGEEKLYRHLFTLGETSMLCPHKVNRRMFLMLQSIIFHQSGRERLRSAKIPSSQTQSSQPAAISFKPSTRVQALAVVTLGKMCLQHEDQAKRIIPALGKMLDSPICSALKINIVFTLSDMCVRYATLVDPLMPQVTACLRDPDVQVRRTTLTLLINLLQEDYLKLKGSFFYRILQCLADEHEDIRSTVLFYVTERLLKRFPKILCQHFIECIFHYNCYEEHESYNKFSQSSLEKELFSLAGKEHTQDRIMIYRFMLDHMSDDQRFTTTQRLCQDVLGAVVDGRIKLTSSSLPMLEDTLTVLRSDEIKLASLKSRPEDTDQPTDQAEQAAIAGMVIKKTIISQVVKRNVIENIVPILIAVKHKLEEQRSPLMKHLLLYLKELMKDYKNEVKEILAGDKQLAKEIEFDLRRIDQEEKDEEEEELQRKAAAKDNAISETGQKENDGDTASEADNDRERLLSLGSSPSLPVRNIHESAPKTPAAVQNELHKQALLNSKALTARRRSSIAPVPFNEDTESGSSILSHKVTAPKSKVVESVDNAGNDDNIKDNFNNDGNINENVDNDGNIKATDNDSNMKDNDGNIKGSADNNESIIDNADDGNIIDNADNDGDVENSVAQKDDTHVDPRPIGGDPSPDKKETTPKAKTPQKRREALMRAISTPQHKPSVISNITFMDESQDVSAISINTTVASIPADKQPKLLLHMTSPEAYAKESDFSRLRRGCRKEERSSESKKSSKQKDRPAVRGLFESYASVATEVDSDDSGVVQEKSNLQNKDQCKTRTVEVRGKGKRTRDMTSLSPDPKSTQAQEQPNSAVKKPSQKRSKAKK